MRFRRGRLWAAILALAVGGGCHGAKDEPSPSRAGQPAAASSSSAPLIPSPPSAPLPGTLAQGTRSIGLAVYSPQPIAPAVAKDAQETARANFPGVNVLFMPMDAPLPQALIFAPDIASFAPPTEKQLAYVGRGLDAAQRHTAAGSKGVLVLGWKLDADPTLDRLREAQRLAFGVAQKVSGFVWDETTGQLFGVASWKRIRMDGWDGAIPDVRQHILLHYETHEAKHRAVTFGMVKFGLPDLVVSDMLPSDVDRMTTLLDAVAQLLVEGGSPGTSGDLAVDLKSIRHRSARDAILAAAAADAQLHGRVALVPAQGQQGDPENRLVELRFLSYPGASDAERAAAALTSIVGAGADR